MKRNKIFAAILCLVFVLTLISCTADMDVGQNTDLAEQFMGHVMTNDYDAAYGMVKATVTDSDFRPYWKDIRQTAEGAKTYELEQIGWQINTVNGVTDRTTAYQVYLDNERTVLLRVMTREGIEGIAGIHFSDITEFLASTEVFVPTVQLILWVFSGLCVVFTLWMLVDCLRCKMKYKVVWVLLILFSLCLSFTVGETSNFSFNVGLFFQTSTITADPGLVAVVTKLVIPVGAILYLCLRKKFTVDPSKPEGEDLPDPFAPAEAGATAQTETPAPAAEADTQEGGEES